jgi:hypothetical protein
VRRRLSYANVTASLALFFAMSGGALAARHYLLNSTKQISPKVLRALKGNTGRPGPEGKAGQEGKAGKEGPEGKAGKEGPAGPYPTVLASGATESGAWGAGRTAAGAETYDAAGSFPIPLSAGLDKEHVIYVAAAPVTHCTGAGHADPGFLCVYQGYIVDAVTPSNGKIFDLETAAGPIGAGAHGFRISLESKEVGKTFVGGSFAVTAP